MASSSHSKTRVSYYYDKDIGNCHYGQDHPMKPYRVNITHDLIMDYGLYHKMDIYKPYRARVEDMTKFHSDEYIKLLESITPDGRLSFLERRNLDRSIYNLGKECPLFEGLFEFCQISAGGSIAAAIKLNKQASDICINWSGGLQHAKKDKASGFCYVNDVVLAILELLKYHQRVLYIDIDVHHGNGVEEAFYTTDRVMTVSFHKYDSEYFPGTGDVHDIGAGQGKYYAINVPLKDGINDKKYESIFQPVISKVMETYQPSVIVLQCGADSLTGDKLGRFNLTVKGHGECVDFVKKYNLPLLMLGGGGYSVKNVSRCWTYETSIAMGCEISNNLPHKYFDYFGPNSKLHINPSCATNYNTSKYLNRIKKEVFENLRRLPPAPSVQVQAIPEDSIAIEDPEVEEKINPDKRLPQHDLDKRIQRDDEHSDSEDEGAGGRRDNRSCKYPTLERLSLNENTEVKRPRLED